MPKQYNTQGYNNDPLHTDYEGFPSSLGGFVDDLVGGLFLGDPDASSMIAGELTGYNAQQREFEQQEYMTDKQNRWNSAQEQMKRAKEAGINPLTAAGGIAGNGTGSAASPEPSSAGAAAGGLNAVSGLANAITGGKASLAKAALDDSTRKEVDTLLPEKLNDLRNSANLKFEEAGLTHAQGVIAAASAEYADENALRDIQMKRVRVSQMSQEYKNLKAIHQQIMADIDLKIKEADLKGSQKDYYDALKLKTDEETRFIKGDNDFWELNGFDRKANSNDLIISQLIADGRDPDAYIQAWIGYHGQYQSAVSIAQADATWHSIPTTPTQALEYSANNIIKGNTWWSDYFKDGVASAKEALSRVKSDYKAYKEFKEEYNDARSDLYDVYKATKRKYRSYRFSGASDVYKSQLKQQMEDAYRVYSEFSEEAFSNELIKRLSPRE